MAMRVLSVVYLFALAGCGERAVTPEIQRAVDVWERGAEAIPEAAVELPVSGEVIFGVAPVTPFSDFDQRVREFLAYPSLADAVQQGPCRGVIEGEVDWEAWVERGLSWADELEQLRALVVLMRVRAPRSVDKQWAALERLSRGLRAAEFAPVTVRLRAAFAPEAISHALRNSLPVNSVGVTPGYQWWVRAAGVTRHRGVLPRLVEWVRTGPFNAALAAARSLEDYDGPDADAARAACAVGLPNSIAVGVARDLMARDRERVHAILLESSPPEETLYHKGLLLAELDDRRGVPILCETVACRSIIDRTIFNAIERLAGPEDLAAVEALPARVRGEQRARADELVAAVRTRLGRGR